ncbi:MAG: 30S ribosomal protein S9, partial [Kiritimatiellae bacterium]|nr:30S ribosomal protein S9 [Kiritimatiellia bacterium]
MSEKKAISAGTGRRKTATARVNLFAGKGEWTVNGVALEQYIPSEALRDYMKQPVAISGYDMSAVDVVCYAKGGGISGQAGAIRHGLSRAIAAADETTRAALKKAGCMTRDS